MKLIPVLPGEEYTISFWMRANYFKGSVSAHPVFFDLKGHYIGSSNMKEVYQHKRKHCMDQIYV
jgi:hypothetical protein